MANFNRSSRSGGGRGFERRGFNDRGSRGPVQMHQAVCDNCKKSCEVPFRPTSGKPIFCSSCFDNNRGADSRRSSNFDDRQMFEAVCDECGNSCKVPFRPSGEKPIYCSNCFGDKKEGKSSKRDQFQSQPQYAEQFEQLHSKLDKILLMLAPNSFPQVAQLIVEEVENPQPEEQIVSTEEKIKVSKKKSSKKK